MKAIKGITINGALHTARDLDMILRSSASTAANPAPKRLTESIPGRHGLFDYSDWFDGVIFYDDREISYAFFFGGTPAAVRETVDALTRFHGQRITVVEDADPEYSITGWATVAVSERAPLGNYVYLTLTLEAEAFRRRLEPTVRRFPDIAGVSVYDLHNGDMPTPLTVTVHSMTPSLGTAALRVSVLSSRYSEIIRTTGTAVTIGSFLLKGGAQHIKFETGMFAGYNWVSDRGGTADVTVSYTEGRF